MDGALSPSRMSSSSPSIDALVIKPRDAATTRSVLIINTGGTIGMKRNTAGSLESCQGYLLERLLDMSEFQRAEMPATAVVELLPLVDSSDMGPEDWDRIAVTIGAAYWNYDGFVVVMGTDTMAYAASALSFMLENLGKPVVVTGSMLPLSDLFNDAQRNLIVSVVIAGMLAVPEVCIFMDARLMRGNRTVKINSEGLDAFDSPNTPPLATLETGIRLRSMMLLPPPKGRFRVHTALEKNIAVWRMIPGFSDEYIAVAIAHSTNLRAIVLELYGTGNLSSRKQSLIEALRLAMSKGVIIVAVSQCLRGRVDLHAYALGRALEDIGVIGAGDATTESVVTKLAFLLSWSDTKVEQVRHYMALSLRGELTEASDANVGGGGNHAGNWATTSRMESGDVCFSGLGRRLDTSGASAIIDATNAGAAAAEATIAIASAGAGAGAWASVSASAGANAVIAAAAAQASPQKPEQPRIAPTPPSKPRAPPQRAEGVPVPAPPATG